MNNRKSQIREHQEAVDELGLSIERQKGELGRLLLDKELIDRADIKEPFESAEKTKNRLKKLEEERNSLKEAMDGKIDSTDRLKELEDEEEEYKKTRDELLVEIGRKGWDLYEHGSLSESEYRPFFTELIEQSRDIEDRERKVRDMESEREQSSFVKKISMTAKITLSKNQIGRLESSMEGYFSTAGEALISSGKVKDIPDEEMQRYASRLKDLEEKAEERQQERERLGEKVKEYEGKTESIAEDASPERKLKSLESELASLQEEHFGRLQKLGDVYYHRSELHDRKNNETKLILDRIEDLESQKQKYQDKIHVLQALIEKEELEEQIKKKEESISKLEKRVQEQKDEIKSLKGEVSNDKNRLTDIDKIVATGKEEGESVEDPAKASSSETATGKAKQD